MEIALNNFEVQNFQEIFQHIIRMAWQAKQSSSSFECLITKYSTNKWVLESDVLTS